MPCKKAAAMQLTSLDLSACGRHTGLSTACWCACMRLVSRLSAILYQSITVPAEDSERRLGQAVRALLPRTTWHAQRLLSWTPHLRQFQARWPTAALYTCTSARLLRDVGWSVFCCHTAFTP